MVHAMSGESPHFTDPFFAAERLRSWQRPRRIEEPLLPPRFSLMALLAVSTAAAIYCGLLRLLGVYGVMLMLAVLVALYFVGVPDTKRAVKRLAIDMLAGIVLPIGCLLFDPGVFRASGFSPAVFSATSGHLSTIVLNNFTFPQQIFIYSLLGGEMVVLLVWLLIGTAFNRFFRSMTSGVLLLGCLIAGAIGMPLALIGLGALGLLEPVGILGLAPWFTFATFRRQLRRAAVPPTGHNSFLASCLGIILIISLSAAISAATSNLAPATPSIPATPLQTRSGPTR